MELDQIVTAALVTAAEVQGVPLPPWAEFSPDDDGGPVTAVVEPVPWGKKSGPHFREPGRFLHLSRENGGALPRRRGIAGRRVERARLVGSGCPRYRTCIEYEGRHHLTPEQQALRKQGWQR